MQTPDQIESILSRLMPTALSEDGQHSIEAMLDELAPATRTQVVPWFRRPILGGIAAAGIGAAILIPHSIPATHVAATSAPAPGIVLVSESDTIRSMADEGWQEDSDGSAMRALRLNVVAENSFLDEETGIVMRISEPREEVLLMPVSAF